MKPTRNLIIGVAYGYDFEKIVPFVHSLFKLSFSGKVLIAADERMVIPEFYRTRLDIDKIDDQGLKKIMALRVVNKVLSARYIRNIVKSYLKTYDEYNGRFIKQFMSIYHVVNARLAFYYKYLEQHPYDNVFMTDVRDVIFQADPFDGFTGGCNAFNENEVTTIGECRWNSSWIREGYGENCLNSLSAKEIYCVGTILADYQSALALLRKMLWACLHWQGRMNIYGPDTGSFNYLIHYNLIENLVKRRNGDIVLTMSPDTYSKVQMVNGQIEYLGKVPAVVHQYDRIAELNRLVHELCTPDGAAIVSL